MDNESTCILPSLLKTAYYHCNKMKRAKFDLLYAPVDLRYCCESLFKILEDYKNQVERDDGQTEFSKSLFAVNGNKFKNICEEAALYGHIKCLKIARHIGVSWNEMSLANSNACAQAAGKGNLECLRYARENGCPWDERTCRNALLNCKIYCLIYARKNECPWDEETCSSATKSHLNCLINGRQNGCPWNTDNNCQYAKWNHKMECLKKVRENRGSDNAPNSSPRATAWWTGTKTSWIRLRKTSAPGPRGVYNYNSSNILICCQHYFFTCDTSIIFYNNFMLRVFCVGYILCISVRRSWMQHLNIVNYN